MALCSFPFLSITHKLTHTLTSGLLVIISSRNTLKSPERDLVLLEEAGKMTYLMHGNVTDTFGLTLNECNVRKMLRVKVQGAGEFQPMSRAKRACAHIHQQCHSQNILKARLSATAAPSVRAWRSHTSATQSTVSLLPTGRPSVRYFTKTARAREHLLVASGGESSDSETVGNRRSVAEPQK